MAKTVIHQENNQAFFGDEDHLEAAQNKSFTQMIFELLSEKEPTEAELKIFELILNISIDHGPDTPSAIKTIEAAKEGKTISESVAAGILQINDVHGGAQEQLMDVLYGIQNSEFRIQNLVKDYKNSGKRLPGFGHRLYKDIDPRAELILNKMKELGLKEDFVSIAKRMKQELENQSGKHFPLNIDGAIAVALCTFGWEPKLGKTVFIIARTAGLCGQFLNI